jgi:hypothetical protein
MRRRTALATAGALTIVLLAAGAAVATNMGLLRISTGTGQVGQLSPANLAPARVVERAAAGDATASGDGGGAGAQGLTGRDEAGGVRSGDDVARDEDDTGHDWGRAPERFQGREDDD